MVVMQSQGDSFSHLRNELAQLDSETFEIEEISDVRQELAGWCSSSCSCSSTCSSSCSCSSTCSSSCSCSSCCSCSCS